MHIPAQSCGLRGLFHNLDYSPVDQKTYLWTLVRARDVLPASLRGREESLQITGTSDIKERFG